MRRGVKRADSPKSDRRAREKRVTISERKNPPELSSPQEGQRFSEGRNSMSGTVLIVVLVLMLVGVISTWPHSNA